MNTPSFQPDPSKQTSDYRTNQLQDAAARTVRVERARLEKLWNQHLDGELGSDSKAEFETLCKRYPDLSRELRTTGMLLSGMNLLTADVPGSPISDRERNAAILAAVQAERPFVSAGEARAIRRQRWILVGSAAALLISVVAADRFFPGWKDPAGMSVAARSVNATSAGEAKSIASVAAASPSSLDGASDRQNDRATSVASALPPASARRDALNANAKLSLGGTRDLLNLSTELAPTMASQAGVAPRDAARSFGLQSQEAWLLRSVSSNAQPIERFVASAHLSISDPVIFAESLPHPQPIQTYIFEGKWKGLLPEGDDLMPTARKAKLPAASNSKTPKGSK